MKTTYYPNPDQKYALARVAHLVGAGWKDKLMQAWLDGAYARHLPASCVAESHLLQQVRNQGGPSWLAKFDLAAPHPDVVRREAGERKVLRHLLRRAKAMGMPCIKVNDGEESYKATSEAQVLDTVFSVDESYLLFARPAGEAGVALSAYIVLGNSPSEVICDHSSPDDEAHPFNVLMAEVMAYGEKVGGL
jgi:hypothetical protein